MKEKENRIVILPAKVISRDEMNLAEFPLTVLSTRSDPKKKTLEFKDTIHGKNGDITNRHWIITGADKFGLPTASDDEVLLGLLKLTVDDGIRNRTVNFTRYEILKTLRWSTEGRNYIRLQKALDRLSGVRIKASNAFFDNELKTYNTRNFGILDAYEINDGRDGSTRPSFFTWSEVLFGSFKGGFIKKLDLDFYLDLKSAVAKRLYRYLDKHFWYKSRIQIDLFVLAHEKIGISRNYRFASSIRQQLDPAVKELIDNGFLGGCEILQKGKGADIVFYASSKNSKILNVPSASAKGENGNLESEVEKALLERGIYPAQTRKIVESRSRQELIKMQKVIEYYDSLCESGSKLVSRSPRGFLYKAVKEVDSFILPGEKSKQTPLKFGRKQTDNESLESQYLIFRKQEVEKMLGDIEPSLIKSIRADVERALRNIRGLISEERFEEAVLHGISEKVAKLYAVPDFSTWSMNHRK